MSGSSELLKSIKENVYVSLSSSWKVDHPNLQELLKVIDSTCEDYYNETDPFSDLDVSDCFYVSSCQESHTQPFRITISTKNDHYIQHTFVISEAKFIEVFGTENEYLFTIKADFLDDFEGMSAYNATITFSKLISSCSLQIGVSTLKNVEASANKYFYRQPDKFFLEINNILHYCMQRIERQQKVCFQKIETLEKQLESIDKKLEKLMETR